ncbi:MAG: exodeoxyribonuclease VII large subunit, partial [Ilumatobacteraceae bacterium]
RTEIFTRGDRPDVLFGLMVKFSNGTRTEVEKYGFVKRGDEAVKHLFRVATGLDAQILGDLQIISQVKQAYDLAASSHTLDASMHRLMQSVFRAHKRSRTETTLGSGAATTAYAAVQASRQALGALEGRDVLLVGTGEVGKVTNAASGHCYFDLIDDESDDKSVLSVKLFRGVRQALATKLREHQIDIVSGIKVRIRGTPDVFATNGSFGFKMSDVDPRFTLGDLAAKRQEIVDRLKKDGSYDRNKKTTLPLVPLGIGLVTSNGSAAYADFMKTIEQSGIGFRVSLCDVRVQGDGSAAEIASAITWLSSFDDVDLVAVVRGGGSKTDLAAFDDELVARAIATCPKPVFTGIGHEVDTSIADEVAYSWNKTPTACAIAIIQRV